MSRRARASERCHRWPIFIPTKGRARLRHTIRAFEKIGVDDFHPVVQPAELKQYEAVVKHPENIIVLPKSIDGLVPTRNWIWDYAQHELGVEWFWTFDDNISCFYRYNDNRFGYLTTGTFLGVIEEFVERFENVALAGMSYKMFVPHRYKNPPFLINTRVYSNMLIRADIPYRNRGIYNDDTDLCLRVLKDRWCIIQFNAFVCQKLATMTQQGGNTPIYIGKGRIEMARSLCEQHPDCAKITWRFGRWQHVVDYRRFRKNRLKLKPGLSIPNVVNDHGMRLVKAKVKNGKQRTQ